MAEIGNVTVRVDAVITDEQYHEAISAVSAANEYIAALEAENAKLRELAEGLIGHVKHPPCEGCIAEMNCDCSDLTQCDEWLFFEADARKLGIEVPQ